MPVVSTTPVLPPMLARPVFGTRCAYGPDGFCDQPATHEVKIVWPKHFDRLERWVREAMEPVCDWHRESTRAIYHAGEADGAVFIERRLPEVDR